MDPMSMYEFEKPDLKVFEMVAMEIVRGIIEGYILHL